MEGDLQLMIFSYSMTMTQDFNQKVQKPFATYLYTHLTLSPIDMMMMGKSFLDNLNLLHARGITLEDAKNLVLFQMNKVWNGLCC